MADRGGKRGRRTGTVVIVVGVAVVAAGGVVVLDRAHEAGGQVTASSVPTGTVQVIRTDLATTTQVDGTLGYAGTYVVVNQDDGTYTALPATGQVILRGQTSYEIDGRAVITFYGTRPAWRELRLGVPDGEDVRQLKENLVALGFAHAGLPITPHFDAATDAAVRRWQAGLGRPATGVVGLGDVVYLPGPLRVTAVQADAGTLARAGSTLLQGTSTDRVVNLSLPVAQQHLIKVGDAVTVTLPDGRTTTAGSVVAVSSVASAASNESGSGHPAGTASGGTTEPLFVTATVRLSDPAVAGNVDQAPVTVNVTTESVQGVLAVPVNALEALAEGGYAVEVVEHGTRRLTAVRTGLFANSLVEVSGPGVAAGTTVEVPSS
ncbi:MAG TPA: peptidoglycan-binding domain-containing protein [Amycolatopsis sp.]|nr:peptidoglycan-binding domain-containing protein [Amycolatopsis sp.]